MCTFRAHFSYSSLNWGDTSVQIGICIVFVLVFVVGEICFLQRGFVTELKTISAKNSLLNVILNLNPNGSSK